VPICGRSGINQNCGLLVVLILVTMALMTLMVLVIPACQQNEQLPDVPPGFLK